MKSEVLQTIEDAVSDVGYWRWWFRKDEICLVEFGGVQLYAYDPKKGAPQSSVIALQFIGSSNMAFYHKSNNQLAANWHELLQSDRIEPFSIDRNQFAFNDNALTSDIKRSYENEITVGNLDQSPRDKIMLSFKAGNVAVVVSGNVLKVVSHSGELAETKILESSKKWWEYWKEYWQSQRTPEPFEKDYACEVTIPAGNV